MATSKQIDTLIRELRALAVEIHGPNYTTAQLAAIYERYVPGFKAA